MRKIPTVFVRDPDDMRHLTNEVHPACRWVLAGEGVATRKYDGTCTMFDGQWWARREVKPGGDTPAGFRLEAEDPNTGKSFGWEPVERSSHGKAHRKALEAAGEVSWEHGTYELCGPKVNRNPEGYSEHRLIRHATAERVSSSGWPPRSTDHVAEYIAALVISLSAVGWEGIVWHHPDGRMAKLKARDYR